MLSEKTISILQLVYHCIFTYFLSKVFCFQRSTKASRENDDVLQFSVWAHLNVMHYSTAMYIQDQSASLSLYTCTHNIEVQCKSMIYELIIILWLKFFIYLFYIPKENVALQLRIWMLKQDCAAPPLTYYVTLGKLLNHLMSEVQLQK